MGNQIIVDLQAATKLVLKDELFERRERRRLHR